MRHKASQGSAPGEEDSPLAAECAPPGLHDADPSYLHAIIERRLGQLAPPTALHPGALHAAMRDILLSPGKRLAPLLAIAAALQLDMSEHAVLDLGCALEMVDAASRLMDTLPGTNHAARLQSQPAGVGRCGDDVALLAAISLLSRAFGVVADAPGVDECVRLQAGTSLPLAVGSLGLCGVRFDDLRPTGHPAPTGDEVSRRTSSLLFPLAAEFAGRVARLDEERLAHLISFASHVGHAYHLLDATCDASAPRAPLRAARTRELLAEHVMGAGDASRRLGPNDEGHEPLRLFLRSAFGDAVEASPC